MVRIPTQHRHGGAKKHKELLENPVLKLNKMPVDWLDESANPKKLKSCAELTSAMADRFVLNYPGHCSKQEYEHILIPAAASTMKEIYAKKATFEWVASAPPANVCLILAHKPLSSALDRAHKLVTKTGYAADLAAKRSTHEDEIVFGDPAAFVIATLSFIVDGFFYPLGASGVKSQTYQGAVQPPDGQVAKSGAKGISQGFPPVTVNFLNNAEDNSDDEDDIDHPRTPKKFAYGEKSAQQNYQCYIKEPKWESSFDEVYAGGNSLIHNGICLKFDNADIGCRMSKICCTEEISSPLTIVKYFKCVARAGFIPGTQLPLVYFKRYAESLEPGNADIPWQTPMSKANAAEKTALNELMSQCLTGAPSFKKNESTNASKGKTITCEKDLATLRQTTSDRFADTNRNVTRVEGRLEIATEISNDALALGQRNERRLILVEQQQSVIDTAAAAAATATKALMNSNNALAACTGAELTTARNMVEIVTLRKEADAANATAARAIDAAEDAKAENTELKKLFVLVSAMIDPLLPATSTKVSDVVNAKLSGMRRQRGE